MNTNSRVEALSIKLDESESKRLHLMDLLDLIQEIVHSLNAGMSINEVIHTTLKRLFKKFPNHRVSYSTVSGKGVLKVLESFTPDQMPDIKGVEADLNVADDYLSRLQSHETLAVEDVYKYTMFDVLHDAMKAGNTRAVLDVPLSHSDDLVGIICLDSSERHRWLDDEIQTVTEVAALLEVSIREAKIQAERQAMAERLADHALHLEHIVQERTMELEKAKTEAEELARSDPLTGLNNRRAFYQDVGPVFNLAQRSGFPFSVLMMDIDWFKNINDTHGHDVGDIVICMLADVLRSTARKSDVIARWGGEEFIIALSEVSGPSAVEYAEKIRHKVSTLSINGVREAPHSFTVSVGVAELNGDIENIDALIAPADKALYQAKNTGRDKVVLDQRRTGHVAPSETFSKD
ncbi:MAG: sensor domain-containing diguanylate cyclase [Methylobacter sp.]|nr:sensor domain-containing diguanylate cyclase [Methylobacter sp.]